MGRDISKRTSGYPVFTPIIDQFLVAHLFADIFYRDILTHQERELATISILAAMPGTDPQLKGHFRVSMNVGLSKAQLEDYIAVLRQDVSKESAERANGLLENVLRIRSSAGQAKSLKVIRKSKSTIAPSKYFTGHATVESRFSADIPDGYRGGL